jgi:hypothetical protein
VISTERIAQPFANICMTAAQSRSVIVASSLFFSCRSRRILVTSFLTPPHCCVMTFVLTLFSAVSFESNSDSFERARARYCEYRPRISLQFIHCDWIHYAICTTASPPSYVTSPVHWGNLYEKETQSMSEYTCNHSLPTTTTAFIELCCIPRVWRRLPIAYRRV